MRQYAKENYQAFELIGIAIETTHYTRTHARTHTHTRTQALQSDLFNSNPLPTLFLYNIYIGSVLVFLFLFANSVQFVVCLCLCFACKKPTHAQFIPIFLFLFFFFICHIYRICLFFSLLVIAFCYFYLFQLRKHEMSRI